MQTRFQENKRLARPLKVFIWITGFGFLAGCVTLVGFETAHVIFGRNDHTVLAGRIYRSAQLNGDELRDVVGRHNIRTVINLRGASPDYGWYQEEKRTLGQLDIALRDVQFSTALYPAVAELRRFVQILETCEYPILLHCRRGADRTGLAAALVFLLQSEESPSRAGRQLSWRYGHLPLGRHCELNEVLDMYQAWLAREGKPHRPELVRRWIMNDYLPGHCWAEIEPLRVPKHIRSDRPAGASFRVYNRSHVPWEFKQSANSGVRLRYEIRNENPEYFVKGAAGYFDAIVMPGESIELTLALPALRAAGRYRLLVDMADEKRWFSMAGSPAFATELIVEDHTNPKR